LRHSPGARRHRAQTVRSEFAEVFETVAVGTFAFLSPFDLDSVFVASLLFCQCGSDRVDLAQWNVNRVRLKCGTCGQKSWLDGFTVSEFDIAKLLTASLID
jgi:hypothetical protein